MVHLLAELLLLRQLEMVQEFRIHLCQDLELQEVYILLLEVLHLLEQSNCSCCCCSAPPSGGASSSV